MRYAVCLLLLATLSLNCTKETADPVDIIDPNIIAAGSYNDLPMLWKDGRATVLPHGNYLTSCTSMCVSGDNVYISGNDYDASNFHAFGRVWKNGVSILLSPNNYYQSIVVSGTDTYLGGTAQNGNAEIWKNGIPMGIGNSIYGGVVNSICISGSDVYACGLKFTSLPGPGGITSAAATWKNAALTSLTNGTTYEGAQSIAVSSGGDVYVAGYQSDGNASKGHIWKNGTMTTTIDNAILNAIAVSGNNVYAAGVKGFSAIVVENGILRYLTDINNTSSSDYVNHVFVSGTDVYAAGSSSSASLSRPTIWKNGSPVYLSPKDTLGEVVSLYIR
jgi:hypothetical protein